MSRTCAQRQHPHRRRLPVRVAARSLLLLKSLQAGQNPGHAAISPHNKDAQAGGDAGKQRQRGVWLLPRELNHLPRGGSKRAASGQWGQQAMRKGGSHAAAWKAAAGPGAAAAAAAADRPGSAAGRAVQGSARREQLCAAVRQAVAVPTWSG